jgi:pimeloyl-ACP methyl ester carboxylesterase
MNTRAIDPVHPETWRNSEGIIDVSGLCIYARRTGRPSRLPAIILEAGAGATSAGWGWVQKCLAQHAMVVSYDRAGLGASACMPTDVGAEATATRLEALLAASGIPGPYILVGHSLGGLFAQYYGAHHAKNVAALVLVDPTPSDRSLYPPRHDRLAALYFVLLRGLQALAWLGLFRIYNPFARLARRSGLPTREASDIAAAFASSRHLGTVVRELQAAQPVRNFVEENAVSKHIPVLVVSAGIRERRPKKSHSAAARFYAAALQSHKDVAARAAFGRHIIIEEADHNTLLTKREFADELCGHILRFAEECRPASASGSDLIRS